MTKFHIGLFLRTLFVSFFLFLLIFPLFPVPRTSSPTPHEPLSRRRVVLPQRRRHDQQRFHPQ